MANAQGYPTKLALVDITYLDEKGANANFLYNSTKRAEILAPKLGLIQIEILL